MRRLEARERRLAALFILVASVALAWFAIVQPVLDGFADRAEQRRALQGTYVRDERIISQLGSIARAAAAQRNEAARYHILAADVSGATAALTERLGQIVAEAGGEVQTAEDMAPTPGLVHARVECRLAAAQLPVVLQRLENGTPLLVVDALAIGANKDAQEAGSDLLDVRIDVSASPSTSPTR